MERLKRDALILTLIAQLKDEGSWCGETHIQKAVFFLEELFRVPLGFEFILYKYGPFSFDLGDALTALRADGLLDLRAQRPYGPRLVPTETGLDFPNRFPLAVARYQRPIGFVAAKFGNMGVQGLEKLATALYVTGESGGRNLDERAALIHSLKPHVEFTEARTALLEVQQIIDESRAAE